MNDRPTQLPLVKLVTEQVPAEHRGWLENSIVGPLNRLFAPLSEAFERVFVSQLNMQVLEHRGLPPSVAHPADFVSRLSGKCAGVAVIYCKVLDSGGQDGASVGALTSPLWVELPATTRGGDKIRITSQQTLTSTTRYTIRWLAVGEG